MKFSIRSKPVVNMSLSPKEVEMVYDALFRALDARSHIAMAKDSDRDYTEADFERLSDEMGEVFNLT